MTNEELADLQKIVRGVMTRSFADGEGKARTVRLSPSMQVSYVLDKDRAYEILRGHPSELYVVVLIRLLHDSSVPEIRICQACSLPFVRTGRKIFCSRTCANRVNQKKLRQKRKEEAKAKARRTRGRKK